MRFIKRPQRAHREAIAPTWRMPQHGVYIARLSDIGAIFSELLARPDDGSPFIGPDS